MTWQDEAAAEFRRLLPAHWEIEATDSSVWAEHEGRTLRVMRLSGGEFTASFGIRSVQGEVFHDAGDRHASAREGAYSAYHAYIDWLDKQAVSIGALILFPSQVGRPS